MTGVYPVLVQLPAHSLTSGPLTYRSELALLPGALVLVPLGPRETLGVVWDGPAALPAQQVGTDLCKVKAIGYAAACLAPLGAPWRRLLEFAAGYYQRSTGEMVIGALPSALRQLTPAQLERVLATKKVKPAVDAAIESPAPVAPFELSPEQTQVLACMATAPGPFLLHGSTGSGKTEVYLRCVQQVLEADDQAQALIMVPEINLTPQMEQRVRSRFEARYGAGAVVALHSGLTPAQRLKSWLAAHRGPQAGGARIVLGTRMAVLASMPRLRLIVVDEEHDASYKQQDGARH